MNMKPMFTAIRSCAGLDMPPSPATVDKATPELLAACPGAVERLMIDN